ncbi:unnamed protein product [Closterium sp. NIES-54]
MIGESADIKRKEGKIRALNAALEEHVVERTEKLQRNNKVLRREMEALLSAGEGAPAAMHQGLGAIEQPHITGVAGA